jgi:hypothetical protein
MLASMSSVEWIEWQAYYEIEPFGQEIEWARFASLMAVVANAARQSNRSRTFKMTDFMPQFEPKRQLTSNELKEKAIGIFSFFGATPPKNRSTGTE